MMEMRAGRASGRFSTVSFKAATLLASGAFAMAWPQAPAQAQSGEIYGASGGRYFEHNCGPGRVLVGLRGSAGVWVDNIQAICGRLDSPASFTDATVDGPIFGGNRPQDQHVECPLGYAVSSAAVGLNDDHPYVGAISLTCTELSNRRDGGSRHVGVQGTGNLEGYSSPFGLIDATPGSPGGFPTCGGNNFAVGIRGRAEQFVDAFGLLCGAAAPVFDSNAGHTLGKRKRSPASPVGERQPGEGMTVSAPGTDSPHTLGKRKKSPPASSQEVPSAINSDSAPAQTDQPVGASIFTDSATPTAAPPEQASPPSELIKGTYLTTVAVTDSRCFQDLRSTRQGVVELTPQPGIVIPLNQINSVFAGPVTLNVQGLTVRQDTTVPLSFGGSVPASFEGAFTTDASRFDVRFEAGTAICHIGGTISGIRN
jgi:hypothetical protein